MKLAMIFALCGVVIFLVSLVFSAVLSFMYSVNPAIIFGFLLVDALVIFIVTAFFMRKHYSMVTAAIKNALRRKYEPGQEIEQDREALAVIREIKAGQNAVDSQILLTPEDFSMIISDIKKMKDALDEKKALDDKMKKEIQNMRHYMANNAKVFERIKTIGLEIKNTSEGIDSETSGVSSEVKQQSVMAGQGVKAIGQEIQNITDLKNSLMHSTKIIEELMDMSKNIKGFVARIADMAKKTNLLALNAGIEAARAGEAGKSFSVVAEEIKTLASNSTSSAQEIAQILHTIQNRTAEVIEIVKTAEKMEGNIKTFYQTGDLFVQIVRDVRQIEKMIGRIKEYTEEHHTDSELLFKIISEVTKKIEDYNKLIDGLEMEIDRTAVSTGTLYVRIDEIVQAAESMIDEKKRGANK